MLDEGLADCAKNIHPVEFEIPSGDKIKLFIENITISQPQVPASCISARNKKIYPTECRQRAGTYTGACTVGVGWAVNGVNRPTVDKSMGEIPVMIRVCVFFRATTFFWALFSVNFKLCLSLSQKHAI